jgi:hypothetical protein
VDGSDICLTNAGALYERKENAITVAKLATLLSNARSARKTIVENKGLAKPHMIGL